MPPALVFDLLYAYLPVRDRFALRAVCRDANQLYRSFGLCAADEYALSRSVFAALRARARASQRIRRARQNSWSAPRTQRRFDPERPILVFA